ncbi:MAG TPA: DUF1553 domain-containing protein, partial [Bryobacteraceae bacterium]|nr:DUF1553 domain-containing protein [Bryobacteraceae bacterium]
GMTVGCARCHDHKYDPIPTKDYYALAGVFVNTIYHEYPMVPKDVADEYKKKEKQIEDRGKLLGEFMQTESSQLAQTLAFQSAKYMEAAWKITGEPKADISKVVDDGKLDYELLERWVKFLAKPPKNYPYLKDWQEMLKKGGTPAEAKKLAEQFQATLVDVMFEHNEIKDTNEIIANKALPTNKKRKYANLPNEFVTNDDFCPGCGLELETLPLDKMNLWTDVFQRELDASDPLDPPNRQKPGLLVFRGWGLERQLSAERRSYIEALKADIEALKKQMPAHFPYVHGVIDAEKPMDLPLAKRGSPFNLGDPVPRHFLSVLSDTPMPLNRGSGRLDLAEDIVKQPLAMRVIVNRIWRGHFGTGIVDTPSNFGITGDRPSDPELLEYLAQTFVDNGMSIKKLHREIMLSSVYQLSDDNVAANYEKDPDNRLYWRANRRRMDSEEIRDAILAVAGDLDTKIGGPSAPLTPDFERRTVYGKVSRYRLDEYLQLFDFPSPNLSAEKRFATNVPLQRLFFMNSDFVQQQAELLARKIEEETDNTARIQKAYRMIFGRAATPDEVKVGLDYLAHEPMKEYDEHKEANLKKEGDGKKDGKLDAMHADAESRGMSEDDDDDASGMMAGVKPGAHGKPDDKKKPPLPVTPWGRYAKILLSSSEFLYVN